MKTTEKVSTDNEILVVIVWTSPESDWCPAQDPSQFISLWPASVLALQISFFMLGSCENNQTDFIKTMMILWLFLQDIDTYAYQWMQWITMAVFYNQVPLADSILLSLFKFSSLLQSEVQPFLSKWCTVNWWHFVESSDLYNRINWELYWTKDECCI